MRPGVECSPQERAQKQRFDAFYLRAKARVMQTIERSVCGCDYGGNSWTTKAEAERICERLRLAPGVRLLELGAGSGWPGLFMAKATGCDVALVDLSAVGVGIAAARAGADGIAGNVWAAAGDAAALPFRDASFDAVAHSDLLCCLERKRAALAACRRALRLGGRMAFTAISVAPGLAPGPYRRAVANGPEFIETDTDYPTLLAETGWSVAERTDVTMDYAGSCRRQLAADEAQEDDLTALLGGAEFAERVAGWRSKLAALSDGLLRRELFVALPAA